MIPLFSPNGLDQSLLIPIALGMLLTSVLTERYGWVFSGLVVPGYLAPLLLHRPQSALLIVLEACLTLWVVRGVHGLTGRTGVATPPFGRDRFLALVVAGVGVRLVVERWALPWVVARVGSGPSGLAAGSSLGAVGLVIVPLLANLLWKPGLVGGLRQVTVTTGCVLLGLEWVLDPLTNFDLSLLESTYEDVALQFDRSAKAELIILVSAFLGSRLNLSEGWDFGGILLPALLALALLEPLRLLSTVVEAVAVWGVARGLVGVPGFNRITWAGPRLIVLLFGAAIVFKLAFGWLLFVWAPTVRFTDLSGFGYILSTLLASKLWAKEARRTLLPTVAVTVVAFGVSGVAAFGLDALGRVWVPRAPVGPGEFERPRGLDATLLRALPTEPSRAVRGAFVAAVEDLLEDPRRRLEEFSTSWTTGGAPYVVVTDPWTRLTVLVSSAGEEAAPVILALGPSEDLVAGQLALAVWAERVQPRVVVVGDGAGAAVCLRALARRHPEWSVFTVSGGGEGARLTARGRYDPALAHEALWVEALPELSVRLGGRPEDRFTASLVPLSRGGLVHVELGRREASRLRAALDPPLRVHASSVAAWLGETRRVDRLALPPQPKRPALHRLLIRELLGWLLRLPADAELGGPAALGRALDVELEVLRPRAGGVRWVVRDPRTLACWVLNPAADAARVHVEAPDPLRNLDSEQVAALLAEAAGARSLGVGPLAPDESAGPFTLTHAAHAATLEHDLQRGGRAAATLHVRGTSRELPAGVDGWITPPEPLVWEPSEVVEPWSSLCVELGWVVHLLEPSVGYGLDASVHLDARVRGRVRSEGVSGLWVSRGLRRSLTSSATSEALLAWCRGVGVPAQRGVAREVLGEVEAGGEAVVGLERARALLARYREVRSLSAWVAGLKAAPAGWRVEVVDDPGAAATLVVFWGPEGEVGVFNVRGRGEAPRGEGLGRALRLRRGWWEGVSGG